MRKEVYTRKPKKAFEKLKKLYEDEIRKEHTQTSSINVEDLNESRKYRILVKIRRKRRKMIVFALLSVTIAITIGTWYLTYEEPPKKINKVNLRRAFNRKTYSNSSNEQLIVDYYWGGSVASETKYKNGYKHQNTESYYSTGEQFRSALYYYDTLLVDYYFFKNGDTIPDLPPINPETPTRIKLIEPNTGNEIELYMLDFKVLIPPYTNNFKVKFKSIEPDI